MKKKLTTTLAGLLATVFTVNANLLFYDDFASTGSGQGFAASSSWDTNGILNNGTLTVDDNGTKVSFRNLATGIDTAGADFWFVANMTVTGDTSTGGNWAGISFSDGSTEDLFFGSDSASDNWEFSNKGGNNDEETSIANYQGTKTLVVAHIAETSMNMWIVPSNTS